MIQRNPRFKVTLAHTNDTATCFGKSDEVLMDYKSVEMMLRLANPLKSVNWCNSILNLNRHSFLNIQLFENDELGNRIMKILKIERN